MTPRHDSSSYKHKYTLDLEYVHSALYTDRATIHLGVVLHIVRALTSSVCQMLRSRPLNIHAGLFSIEAAHAQPAIRLCLF